MSEWWVDANSLASLGASQVGKTSVVRELHAETSRVSIWLNETGDERVGNVTGKRVRSTGGLKSGFAEDVRRYNFLSRDRRSDVVGLQEWLWSVAERADRRLPLQVVIDEAHRAAPQTNADGVPHRDAVRKLSKEGIKRNIKLVLITQDPVAIDKQALRQMKYRLVFPMANEQWDALSKYGFRRDLVEDAPEYTGVLHHQTGGVLQDEVRAKEKYA